jgi:3-demethoxyubiquinol 3-hydroxylase
MIKREFSTAERLISELDNALRVLNSEARSSNPNPGNTEPEEKLSKVEKRDAASLMRVNHAGEVAAQALYRGQAMVTSNHDLREQLLESADEEHDHLAWCEHRVKQLGSHTSALNPLWYGGSFVIGIIAGLAGDKTSLGFLAETENQVTTHLNSHLTKLPINDRRSRKIVTQMRDDEIRHGDHAIAQGGEDIAKPIKKIMIFTSKIMTKLAYHI